MDENKKENNRLWILLARKTAREITNAEEEELSKLLQEQPYSLYIQDIISQQWQDKHKNFSEKDIYRILEKHKQKLLPPENAEQYEAIGYTASEEISYVNKKSVVRRILRYASVAAACVIAALAIWKWSVKPEVKEPAPDLQQLATQNGSRSQLVLSDGTKVWLNAGSKLEYPKQFSANVRSVSLEGEAYFDVTHIEGQPFLVHTKTFTVKVLGTAFNIRAYNDEDSAATSLIRGKIAVQLNADTTKTIMLRPKEKLIIPTPSVTQVLVDSGKQKTDISRSHVLNVNKAFISTDRQNTVLETAWTENKLAFKNTSFDKIAMALEKWFGVEIHFKNDNKKKLNLTGTFEGESLEEILNAFRETGNAFKYSKDSNGVIWIE